jgi:hypothetical protein
MCERGTVHHPHANLIMAGGAFDTADPVPKVLIQNHVCIQERRQHAQERRPSRSSVIDAVSH